MAIVLFDNHLRKSLYPFTYTKAIAELRFGIFSIKERWAAISGEEIFIHTEKYLQPLYQKPDPGKHYWIDASLLPDLLLWDQIKKLDQQTCLANNTGLLAAAGTVDYALFDPSLYRKYFTVLDFNEECKRLEHPWQMMLWNDEWLRKDFELITAGRKTAALPASVNCINEKDLFIEEGAKLNFCTLNAATGPVYIGKNAEVMEGSVIRGPFCLGENSVIKMNSRIYGATTLGPFCMGGGEIKNAVMMGYSNKAHDGYLGDSVVGEWCNFGAGSTNSNIKNTAGDVKIWDLDAEEYVTVGQKCGLIMGHYSRAAINSSINTGSMIGICCNVFGEGLLPTIIPNFSWGVKGTRYVFEKALTDIHNWKMLKGEFLTAAESSVLATIFAQL